MDLQELLKLLGIEEPEEFEYYENFADLVESDEDISVGALVSLFSDTDPVVVSDIIQQYFDDMMETIPQDELDMHILLENIKLSLMGLLKSGDDEKTLVDFGEEVGKFKTWYSFESAVECISLETGKEKEKVLPLRDALTLLRLEKLGEEEYSYDFSECLDYELEDYIMSFADLARAEAEEEEDLIQNGYSMDDEPEDQLF